MSRMLTDIEYAFRQIRLARESMSRPTIVFDCLQRAEDALERVREAAALQEAGRNCCYEIGAIVTGSSQDPEFK